MLDIKLNILYTMNIEVVFNRRQRYNHNRKYL